MVGKLCSAKNCNNETFKEKNFFRFPVDVSSARIWVINCNREELLGSLNTLYTKHWLCEDHFEERMFLNRKHTRLKPNAYPTLFNLSKECMCEKQDKAVVSDHSYAALRELPGKSKQSEPIVTHMGRSGAKIPSKDVLADLIEEFDIPRTLTEDGSEAVSQNETSILGIETVDEFLANFISKTEIKAAGVSAAECEKANHNLHMGSASKKSSKFEKETPVTTEENKSTDPSKDMKKLHDQSINVKCRKEEMLENPIEYEYFEAPPSENKNNSIEATQCETNSADESFNFLESSVFIGTTKSEKEPGNSHKQFEYETEFKKFLQGIPRDQELAASEFEKIASGQQENKIVILSNKRVSDHKLCNARNVVNSSKKGGGSSEICDVLIPDKLPDSSIDHNIISLDDDTSSSTLSATESIENNPDVDSMQKTYSKPEENISSVDRKINLDIFPTRKTLPDKNIASPYVVKDFCENVKKRIMKSLSGQEKDSSKIIKNQTTPKMENFVSVEHQNKRNRSLTSSEEKSPPSKKKCVCKSVNSTLNSRVNYQNSNQTIPNVNSTSQSPSDRILRSKQRTVPEEVQVEHKSKIPAPTEGKKCVTNDNSAKLPVTLNGSSKGLNTIADAKRSNIILAADQVNAPIRSRSYVAVYHGDKLLVTPDKVPSNRYISEGARSNLLATANPPIAAQSYVAVCHGDKLLVTPDRANVGHKSNLLVTGVRENVKAEVGQTNKSQNGNPLNVSTIEPNYVLVGDSLLVNTTGVPPVQKLVPDSSFVRAEKLPTVPGDQKVVTASQDTNLLAASSQIVLPTEVRNLIMNPEQLNGAPKMFTFRQDGKTFLVVPEVIVPSLTQSLNNSHRKKSGKDIVVDKVNSSTQNGDSIGVVNTTPTTLKGRNEAPKVRNTDLSPDKRRSLTKEIHISVTTQTNQYLSANSPRKQKLKQTIKELNRENRLLKKKLGQLEARLSGKR